MTITMGAMGTMALTLMMMAMGTIVVLSGSRLGYDNRSTIRVRVGVSQHMLHGHQYVATVSTICITVSTW